MKVLRILGLISFLAFTCCTKKSAESTVWIYTSIYKNVIQDIEPVLAQKVPGVKFEWFQSGSENVAARVNAELSAGRSQADLILTSDPMWYLELKKANHLIPYDSEPAKAIEARFRDPEHYFNTVRINAAVIAYNKEAVPQPPENFKDLNDAKFKGKVSMASPMESGTALLMTAILAKRNTWTFFEGLRKQDLLSAGGNSAVISRIETKERPVGLVLLENVLEAKKKGSPVEAVYPKDGTVLIPSPIGILSKTKNPELAKKVYDAFFSKEVQEKIVAGRMYSPLPGVPSPEGARPLAELLQTATPWDPTILAELFQTKEDVKKRFRTTVLN